MTVVRYSNCKTREQTIEVYLGSTIHAQPVLRCTQQEATRLAADLLGWSPSAAFPG